MINKKAFTLVEIAIVAIIVGILMLIAIPNMLKGVNRGYAQDAMRNLIAIYAAQQNYAQNNGGSFKDCTADGANLTACINNVNGLGLNIVSNGGTTYTCGPTSCTATGSGGIFTMVVDLNMSVTVNNIPHYYVDSSTENPYCVLGAHIVGSPCP